MKTYHLILWLTMALLVSSCFKEDEKITPHDPGDVQTATIELTKDYRYQVYFDLSQGMVVAENLKKEWDLAFEGSAGGYRILLNTSNFMLAAGTGLTDFTIPIDTAGLSWKFDASSGNQDSLAFKNWIGYTLPDSLKIYSNEVYVVDRGYDEAGNLRGLKKVIFLDVTDTTYTLRFGGTDDSDGTIFTIRKDSSVNYTCFSFDDGGKQLDLEPPKDRWDLLFTQYTTLLYTNEGEPYPYLLTGVLSNQYRIEVAQDTLYEFGAIDYDAAKNMVYSGAQDEIGYDWKDVVGDVSSGNVSYVIIEGRNYVIRARDGYYTKLRFTGFYSNSGEKGYPTFEFQKL